jgi:hypothetical protein
MSGCGGHGGTDAFRMYLDQSIWGQFFGGQSALGSGHPQAGRGLLQTLHVVSVTSTKCSVVLN